MSTAATGGFVVLVAIALQLWLFDDSQEPPQLAKRINATYDYIVVGAGSAGCVVASRLSEDKNVTVLLLEAGDFDDHRPQIIVPALLSLNFRSRFDWWYETEPQNGVLTGLQDGRSYWPVGRVLGGSSSINYMGHMRASRHDYDRWAQYTKDERWNYGHVLPYFKKSENVNISWLQDSQYRGHSGPIPISSPNTIPLTDKIIEAAQAAGYPYNADYNGRTMEGICHAQSNIMNGERVNVGRAFIHPVLDRSNLHVALRAQATKIIISDKRAVGVEVVKDSRRYIVSSRREIILSAGAVGSPQILMLSGVGPRDHLEDLKIPVVADLPVGQNLQDHLKFVIGVRIKEALTTPLADIVTWWTKLQYALFRSGPLSTSTVEVLAFKSTTKKTKEKDWPDLQMYFFESMPTGALLDYAEEIPVVADLPVGQNLQDHLFFDIGVRIREALTTPLADIVTWWTKLQYALFRSGPLSSPATEVLAFKSTTKKTKAKDWPDLQIIFVESMPTNALLDYAEETKAELADRNRGDYGFICFPGLLRPESRGNITLRSADPFDYPIIHANYLDKQTDIETIIRGIQECKNIVDTKPMRDIGAELTEKRPESACRQYKYDSHEYWECLVKHRPLTIHHPVGTCKMGPKGDRTAVVDSELRVQGISGLRVADASIMPWQVSGSTNAPTIMIGERAADLIKGDSLSPGEFEASVQY